MIQKTKKFIQGSKDNLSCILLQFKNTQAKPVEELYEHDENINNQIKQITKGTV